jgi:hypothetical protein
VASQGTTLTEVLVALAAAGPLEAGPVHTPRTDPFNSAPYHYTATYVHDASAKAVSGLVLSSDTGELVFTSIHTPVHSAETIAAYMAADADPADPTARLEAILKLGSHLGSAKFLASKLIFSNLDAMEVEDTEPPPPNINNNSDSDFAAGPQ